MSEAATPQEDLGDDAEHRSGPDIGRSSAIMASGTLFSRVLGFARNSLTAYVVGLTIIAADAWNAANTLPNIFHLLIAGGVLNAVIVPQITRAMRDADGGTTYINRLLTLSVTALAVITLLLMLAAPLLVSLVVSSSWPPEARTLATAFAVLCLPQVFFYGLYTLLGQVLTAHNRFGMFMWAPGLANIVAIAGLGNCATSLIQGVEYYKDADPQGTVPGLMHVTFGDYHVSDVQFVAAFDVDDKKVGKDLAEAINSSENNTIKIAEVPTTGVTVQRGHTLDGIGKYYALTIDESPAEPVDVVQALRDAEVDVLVSYLPVGSEEADKFYAQCAIDAGVAFVNALPVFIASDPEWAQKFADAGVPIIGDDIKSQVGATITKIGRAHV